MTSSIMKPAFHKNATNFSPAQGIFIKIQYCGFLSVIMDFQGGFKPDLGLFLLLRVMTPFLHF